MPRDAPHITPDGTRNSPRVPLYGGVSADGNRPNRVRRIMGLMRDGWITYCAISQGLRREAACWRNRGQLKLRAQLGTPEYY